jgi:hypothetical protein
MSTKQASLEDSKLAPPVQESVVGIYKTLLTAFRILRMASPMRMANSVAKPQLSATLSPAIPTLHSLLNLTGMLCTFTWVVHGHTVRILCAA